MEKKDNILLAILAGIGGTLLGGIIYYIVTEIGFISYLSSIAGVFLSITFFSSFKKLDKKTMFPVILLFMIINLLMIFVVDAIIFAREVTKYYDLTFMEAFTKFPEFLSAELSHMSDYGISASVNIFIVIIGTVLISASMYQKIKHKEAIDKFNKNRVIDNDEEIYSEHDDENDEI